MSAKKRALKAIVPSELTSELLEEETKSSSVSTPAPERPSTRPEPTQRPRPAQARQSQVLPPKRGHQIQASGRLVRRMTVNLDAELGTRLAQFCLEQGRTQSDVIAEGLETLLPK